MTWSGIDHYSSGWHIINLSVKKKCKGPGGWGVKKSRRKRRFSQSPKQAGVGKGKGRVVRLAGAECAVVYTGNEFLFIASYGGETTK